MHIADRSLGRLGPFWVIEDAAREAEASSRLLLALSCYGQRSCRVHCCSLELHALQVHALCHRRVSREEAMQLTELPPKLRADVAAASAPTERSFEAFTQAKEGYQLPVTGYRRQAIGYTTDGKLGVDAFSC